MTERWYWDTLVLPKHKNNSRGRVLLNHVQFGLGVCSKIWQDR